MAGVLRFPTAFGIILFTAVVEGFTCCFIARYLTTTDLRRRLPKTNCVNKPMTLYRCRHQNLRGFSGNMAAAGDSPVKSRSGQPPSVSRRRRLLRLHSVWVDPSSVFSVWSGSFRRCRAPSRCATCNGSALSMSATHRMSLDICPFGGDDDHSPRRSMPVSDRSRGVLSTASCCLSSKTDSNRRTRGPHVGADLRGRRDGTTTTI